MSEFVNVRFDEEDRKLLVKVCQERREQISSFVRAAVMRQLASLGYLSTSEKRSLGVGQDQSISKGATAK
jgi:hypothetical protein